MAGSSVSRTASLLVATTNQGKVRELETAFAGWFAEILSLSDFAAVPVAPEDEDTFAANACEKALHYHRHCNETTDRQLYVLADDSGLAVDALEGRPGVYSARYAGEGASDQDNIAKLLSELEAVDARGARFVCVLALVGPGEALQTSFGSCEGAIARSPQGDGGFGYDPIFVPEGYDVSFAEQPELKRELSHRAEAIRELLALF